MRPLLVRLALLSIVLSACGLTSPGAQSPRPQITDATRRELELVLQNYAAGLLTADQKRFQGTIDLSRAAFRRCQNELFESASGTAPLGSGATTIVKLEQYRDYVRAYVDEGGLGIARRYFRRDEARWVLSEPTSAEAGAARTKTADGLTLEYQEVDEDLAETILREGVAARDFLRPHAPRREALGFRLRLYPTAESVGVTQGCFAVAAAGGRDDPVLRLYSVWLAPSLKELSDQSRESLRREGLHLLQREFLTGFTARVGQASWWAAEGWPEQLLGAERFVPAIKATVCRGQVFSLRDLSEGLTPELALLGPQVGLALYGQATSMVDYTLATYGAQAYWKFVAAHEDSLEPKVLYEKAFRVAPERFYADWQAWAKKKHC